ncbi:MAG: hypothetical protein R6U94_04310 [Nitriliruptoraceae bacterium]
MTTTLSVFRSGDGSKLQAGEALFRAGDPADVVYVVQSGRLEGDAHAGGSDAAGERAEHGLRIDGSGLNRARLSPHPHPACTITRRGR